MKLKFGDLDAKVTARLWSVVDRAATVAVLVAAVVFFWNGSSSRPSSSVATSAATPMPAAPIPADDSPTMGASGAKVVLIEFSDFRCSYCQRFAAETLPSLKADYVDTGLVRFVYRHNPLSPIQDDIVTAAEAAECAWRQGDFWSMHDRLFESTQVSDEPYLTRLAEEIGLDEKTFRTCLTGEGKERVRRDAALAASLQVRGTPVFFVGTVERDGQVRVSEVIAGARPVAEFRAAIDKLLRAGATTRS